MSPTTNAGCVCELSAQAYFIVRATALAPWASFVDAFGVMRELSSSQRGGRGCDRAVSMVTGMLYWRPLVASPSSLTAEGVLRC